MTVATTPEIGELPQDLSDAFEGATSLLEFSQGIVDVFNPRYKPEPVNPQHPKPVVILSRSDAIPLVAQQAVQLETGIEELGPLILVVSDEITAANRDPIPLGEWLEVQPNAHRAALLLAETVTDILHETLGEVIPDRYACEQPNEVLRPRLRAEHLVQHDRLVGRRLADFPWPDWSELNRQVIVEAATTAHARRQSPSRQRFWRPEDVVQAPKRTIRSRRPDPLLKARDRWMSQQYRQGKSLSEILFALHAEAERRGWADLGSVQGVHRAIQRCQRHR